MPKRPQSKRGAKPKPDADDLVVAPPRIVGGHLRGRKLLYSGDPLTRPMKDRVREAVFNLVGPDVKDKLAIDLFAGTGALGFEAISRGAARAIFLERHFPTADLIKQTARELGVAEQCQVTAANTFIWAQRDLPTSGPPWAVFVSPPWSLFREQAADMLQLINIFVERSPLGSVIVVEADGEFDFATLPQAAEWDVRVYMPAVVGVFRREAAEG